MRNEDNLLLYAGVRILRQGLFTFPALHEAMSQTDVTAREF